ncbi:MAG: DUF2975 domain-containing protein [Arachnia propionica]|uniref:DUF2975 domain-containing protein n=1 Tax=Arachnia propionica TaxID=1750 RepID=UPI00270F1752|nr:DUF2975 domain-containing protein [Arachnia propionica]
MPRSVIIALRIVMVLAVLGVIALQGLIVPLAASEVVAEFPEVSQLRWPYLLLTDLVLACFLPAALSVWMLLDLVSRRDTFTPRALGWVDLIIGCAVVATVLALAGALHLTWLGIGGPPVLLVLTGSLLLGPGFILLMLVLRHLLKDATALRTELAEVI